MVNGLRVLGVAGPKKAVKASASTGKSARYYPADDVPRPKHSRKKHNPPKVRASFTPGTVCILLSGRFRGKRVVCLKALESGLLLVSGPYKINGVPLRRVNQAYVIGTSTKIDVSGVDVSKINDEYFARGKRSVLALSCSMNNSATTYWSTSVVQDDIGQEASNSLCTGMSNACEAFKRANGTYPAQVIFYRDGVGEGQVEAVCRAEINQIKQAFSGLSLASTKLMYINTSKRVNTRIFAGQPGRFQNPMPGTVIDSAIVDKDVYEFYLVSVAARQGMTTPTRYTVVYDSIAASPDKIESLTYKLCYTYYNVSGAIKEPSVIRYAHRLAALVGERGGRGHDPPQPHPGFEQKDPSLYFI